jgi:2,4'-dihydroxyacetophenone dioxygenase
VVGDEDMVAFVVVTGEVEFIGPGGEVRAVANACTQRAEYVRYCEENDIPARNLDA